MELGEKIRRARLEAGLSQRQLCGEEVTRNMLSQIENGAAQPSMGTLFYFAARLGKPVSYFLEEDAILSPNQDVMARARQAALAEDWEETARILEEYRQPDETFDAEYRLLRRLSMLAAAENAVAGGQGILATQLLEQAGAFGDGYCAAELERRRLLLLAKAKPRLRGMVCENLPSMDEELLLRARVALDEGAVERAVHLLESAEDRNGPDWNFLRGETYMTQRQFREAAACYHKAEEAYPTKTAIRLERCYRELEDYKQAYFYACKHREV